ncbi:MAG: hypothetical protein ABGX16_10790 [Pirellulales bacterium]
MFSKGWRKSHAKTYRVKWEMRGKGIGVGDGVGADNGTTQQNGYDELQSDETLSFTFNHDLTITQANVGLFQTLEDRQLWQVGAGPVYTIEGGGLDGGDFDFAIDVGRTGGVPTTGLFVPAGEALTIRGGHSDALWSTALGTQVPSTADGVIIGFTMNVNEMETVPEPSTIAVWSLLGLMGAVVWKKQKRTTA